MSSQPLNLVERAAERLRQTGQLDGSTVQLLAPERSSSIQPAATGSSKAPPGSPGPAILIESATLERASMVDWSKGRNRISEEFRVIQGQVLRTAFGSEHSGPGLANVVMISSAHPGEGKSFAALNLALSIARQRDREVLLVDTDSQNQSLGRSLGLIELPGLLDLALDQRLNADDLIVRTGYDKLGVLPIGTRPEKSAELLATRQMARLIRDLGHRYADRLVILDSTPCLSSSDPSALASTVGQVILVVEAERTQQAEVEAALDLIQVCPAISLLLNKLQLRTSNTFGAYANGYEST
jgi:exopolysaccharide/PEP-CTERM locus tyrosine autokinase